MTSTIAIKTTTQETEEIYACDKLDFKRAFIEIITTGVIEVGSNDESHPGAMRNYRLQNILTKIRRKSTTYV